jgi:hypothetical protein
VVPTPAFPEVASTARSFLDALAKPSWGSTLGAISIAVGLLIACVLLITPARIARLNPGYLLNFSKDGHGLVSWRAFRIVEAGPQPPAVALLGASSMFRAITSETDVASVIHERSGRAVPVYNLTAGGLSPWEMASLMDLTGERFNGAIVIGIGAELLATPRSELQSLAKHPRLAFGTPVFDEEVRIAGFDPQERTGNYFIDNSQFFTARIGAVGRLITGPIDLSRLSDTRRILDQETWRFQVDRVSAGIRDGYPAFARDNLEVVERLIARARERGDVRIALLVTPINPRALAEFEPGSQERFLADARTFAAKVGAELWELDDDSNLKAEDFDDWCHLGDKAVRARYTRVLSEHIAEFGEFSRTAGNSM